MAAKPATTTGGGQQIVQMLTTLTSDQVALKAELKADIAQVHEAVKALIVTLTQVEHKMATLDVGLKTANTKRAPKVAADTASAASTAAAVAPAPDKFPTNTMVWLGNRFKNDPENVKKKYFSEAQVNEANAKLLTVTEYTSIDVETGKTEAAKESLRGKKIYQEFQVYWALAKNDAALSKKLKDEWAAEKSEYESKNRTPATKE